MNKDKINFGNQEETQMDNFDKQDVQADNANEAPEVIEQVEEEIESNEPEIAASQSEDLQDQVATLQAALTASEEKVRTQQDEVLRALADMENMRRRTEQEIDKARKFALERFSSELLPVLDNLERAVELADKENETLKPMLEGVELTLKTMQATVEKFGLKVIDPQGEAFDPTFHQAMSIQESADFAPNTVMMVMQKGYELNGRVVRPAMVMVSKAVAGNVNETV